MLKPTRVLLATAAVALTGALAPGAAAARDGFVTSFDGTHIVYSFFPAANLPSGAKAPTVLIGPGYSSGRDTNPDSTSEAVFGAVGLGPLRAAGYNVLTWDPRGFGDSGGSVEVDSPDFEGRDVQALIDLVAQQPEAQLDGPGDPRMGMSGVSYGGGIQLVTAAIDKRVDAITPTIAWHSLVTSLYKNQTAKGGWGTALFGLGNQSSLTSGIPAGVMGQPNGVQPPRSEDPHIMDAYLNGLATGTFPDADVAFFDSRGPGDALMNRVTVPALLIEGTADTLFTLHEAITNEAILRRNGVPTKMLWFCGGHGVCSTNQGSDPLLIEKSVIAWLNRYVKRDASVDTGAPFRWISDDGVLHGADGYPLPPGTPLIGEGSGTLPLVPGDTSGALIAATPAVTPVSVPLSRPAAATELVGEPTLTLTYQGTATSADDRIYAQIVDDQKHLVLGNQVTPIRVALDGASHTLTLPLEGVAIHAAPGASYTLQIVSGSNVYFAQRAAGVVTFSRIAVSVPTAGAGASMVLAGSAGTTGCAASRSVRLRLRRRPVLRSAVVYAGGRRVATLRGARLRRTLSLTRPETGPLRVRVVERTRSGRSIVTRRTYRACGDTTTIRRYGPRAARRRAPRFTG